jgi:excisionase family DNA binding protein
MTNEEWLTTSDAAQLSGYHVERIRELIREGKITARKFGPVWAVHKGSLLAYVLKMEEAGNKRGPNQKEPGF